MMIRSVVVSMLPPSRPWHEAASGAMFGNTTMAHSVRAHNEASAHGATGIILVPP
jgi:hypothetical protein